MIIVPRLSGRGSGGVGLRASGVGSSARFATHPSLAPVRTRRRLISSQGPKAIPPASARRKRHPTRCRCAAYYIVHVIICDPPRLHSLKLPSIAQRTKDEDDLQDDFQAPLPATPSKPASPQQTDESPNSSSPSSFVLIDSPSNLVETSLLDSYEAMRAAGVTVNESVQWNDLIDEIHLMRHDSENVLNAKVPPRACC